MLLFTRWKKKCLKNANVGFGNADPNPYFSKKKTHTHTHTKCARKKRKMCALRLHFSLLFSFFFQRMKSAFSLWIVTCTVLCTRDIVHYLCMRITLYRRHCALFMHYLQIVHTLFMGLITTLFRKKILKMSLMILFTHLKIILLQYFQFSVK